MSGRGDIVEGRLVYSCNCGWLDRTHAGMGAYAVIADIEDGVHNLWKQIYREHFPSKQKLNGFPAFEVRWKQQMGSFGLRSAYRASYLVRSGITIRRKRAIALRILLDVAFEFESIQASPPYSVYNDSGFSAEDLVSDAIGLYNAMDVIGDPAVDSLCQVVSKAASLKVWDAHMKAGLGASKNHSFSNPLYFPCDECEEKPAFPMQFTSVERANYDVDFIPLMDATAASGLRPGCG